SPRALATLNASVHLALPGHRGGNEAMSENHPQAQTHPVPEEIAKTAHVDQKRFQELRREAGADPDRFWNRIGQTIDWIKPYSRIRDVNFDLDDLHIRWFDDGTLNVAANCLDRHLETRGDQVAILWEGD